MPDYIWNSQSPNGKGPDITRIGGTNLKVKSGAVTEFVALKTSVLTTPTFFHKLSGLSLLFSEPFGAVCDLQYE